MKIPAAFAPKSWEMPPGFRVLEERASVVTREFDGEKLDWLVALIKSTRRERSFTWARPLDTRFDAGFIAPGSLLNFISLNKDLDDDDSYGYFNSSWNQYSLIRCFFVNRDGALRSKDDLDCYSVGVAHSGFAAWNALAAEKERITNFRWSSHTRKFDKFLKLQASDLWARLQNLLVDSGSDASFSCRFMKMNDEERHCFIFNRSIAESYEFYSIIYARLLLPDVWDDLPAHGQVSLWTGRYNQDNPNSIHWKGSGERKRMEISEMLSSDIAKVQSWFFPLIKDVVAFTCVQEWLQRFYPYLKVNINYPTAHEQLEAQLRWREWKANHEKL